MQQNERMFHTFTKNNYFLLIVDLLTLDNIGHFVLFSLQKNLDYSNVNLKQKILRDPYVVYLNKLKIRQDYIKWSIGHFRVK